MPRYTFCCQSCQHEFSDNFPMSKSEGDSISCPKCNKKNLSRVYKSGVAVRPNGIQKETAPLADCSSCSQSCKI